MHTIEAFRSKLAVDFSAAMKASTSSRIAHCKWFMPIHVMVDMFYKADNMCYIATMYNFGSPRDVLLNNLMDPDWDVKQHTVQDIIKCVVNRMTIRFWYHVVRQTLYANFQYIRHRWDANGVWGPLDQERLLECMAHIAILFGDSELPEVEVGGTW